MEPFTVWCRVWEDTGNIDLGILEELCGHPLMDVGDFAFYFTLDLSKWEMIGDL